MTENNEGKDNLVDMAEARKRQRTIKGASSKSFFGQKDKSKAPGNGAPSKVWGYIQVALFLGLLFIFLKMCEGR